MHNITICFGGRRRLISIPSSYEGLVRKCRETFPNIGSVSSTVVLFDTKYHICDSARGYNGYTELDPDAYHGVPDGAVLFLNVAHPLTKEYLLPLPNQDPEKMPSQKINPDDITTMSTGKNEMDTHPIEAIKPQVSIQASQYNSPYLWPSRTSTPQGPPCDYGPSLPGPQKNWGAASEQIRRSANLIPTLEDCKEAAGLAIGESNWYVDEEKSADHDEKTRDEPVQAVVEEPGAYGATSAYHQHLESCTKHCNHECDCEICVAKQNGEDPTPTFTVIEPVSIEIDNTSNNSDTPADSVYNGVDMADSKLPFAVRAWAREDMLRMNGRGEIPQENESAYGRENKGVTKEDVHRYCGYHPDMAEAYPEGLKKRLEEKRRLQQLEEGQQRVEEQRVAEQHGWNNAQVGPDGQTVSHANHFEQMPGLVRQHQQQQAAHVYHHQVQSSYVPSSPSTAFDPTRILTGSPKRSRTKRGMSPQWIKKGRPKITTSCSATTDTWKSSQLPVQVPSQPMDYGYHAGPVYPMGHPPYPVTPVQGNIQPPPNSQSPAHGDVQVFSPTHPNGPIQAFPGAYGPPPPFAVPMFAPAMAFPSYGPGPIYGVPGYNNYTQMGHPIHQVPAMNYGYSHMHPSGNPKGHDQMRSASDPTAGVYAAWGRDINMPYNVAAQSQASWNVAGRGGYNNGATASVVPDGASNTEFSAMYQQQYAAAAPANNLAADMGHLNVHKENIKLSKQSTQSKDFGDSSSTAEDTSGSSESANSQGASTIIWYDTKQASGQNKETDNMQPHQSRMQTPLARGSADNW